ncbi:hypothetical protein PV10_08521 [Exophiala mesophila]|uniref:C2H2-type domain-containing protein n=1 Tax=Exophiala mesophila TaxID=212818 RepID=A0A0D1WJ26_EXOME|nr:uncharacterized protein PV10_08521 [Exophiala mesophila]KIV88890.1 hypothetical protein PV10_08521 [Exophiala mesophila]
MVLRQCTICGRKFTKTEHFKRHERSHTRERPYSCSVCQKTFSRSDVLFRHMKCHNQRDDKATAADQAARRNTISEGVVPKSQKSPSDDASPSTMLNSMQTGIPLMQILSPSNYTSSTNEQSNPSRASADMSSSYLDSANPQLNPLQMQLNSAHWNVPSPLATTTKPELGSHMSTTNLNQVSGQSSSLGNPLSSPTNTLQTQRPELASTQFLESSNDWLPNVDSSNQTDFHDPFQMWLFPSLGDLDQSPDFLPPYGLTDQQGFPSVKDMHANGIDTAHRSRNIAKVPRERFSRVQKCWNPRPGRVHRIMSVLWKELADSPLDNLFSESPNAVDDFKTSTNWGLDVDCRLRLRDQFRTPAPSVWHSPRLQPSTEDIPPLEDNEFPPAEILDIALGLFFRRFHPTVPFIHFATFSVRNTPSPMLFAMCLIGLSILGTTGATRFVAKMFPPFLKRVSSELAASISASGPATPQMGVLATALLTLNLSVLTGDKDSLHQSQILYATLMSLAQQNSLFVATEGPSLDALVAEMSESDDRWKAWSRIESAKRLILGLLLVDSWYSNLLSKPPIVRSESVCVIAPCDEALFQAKSATQWQSLLRSGKSPTAPMFRIQDLYTPELEYSPKLGYLGTCSLLALLQIQVLEAYQRLMPPDPLTVGSFIPWHVYEGDKRARSLIPSLLAGMRTAGPLAKIDDTNCTVLWHSICIMLLADFRMFELAAGRHGAGPATGALENISQWSQTQSARRACVHAAQTFKLMSERRVSDNVSIHSVTALFSSALVLGLYLFMVSSTSMSHHSSCPVELVDVEPDWATLGDLGFKDHTNSLDPHQQTLSTGSAHNLDDDQLCPIYHFVKSGRGTVSLGGASHQGGYESARRVLLDFANLMDGISGRRLRMFTQVLHIMSDDLMNVDASM